MQQGSCLSDPETESPQFLRALRTLNRPDPSRTRSPTSALNNSEMEMMLCGDDSVRPMLCGMSEPKNAGEVIALLQQAEVLTRPP